MNRRRRQRAVLLTCGLLLLPVGGVGLWGRAQRWQYALNRQLVDALVKGDDRRALALVEAGVDPNTRYTPTPMPSLSELVKQLLHRSPPPVNDSPAAWMIVCGTPWFYDDEAGPSRVEHPLI